MFNIVEKRRWYFILSTMIIIPGLIVMGYSWATVGAPFRLSIDFLGGSIYNLTFIGGDVTEDGVRLAFEQNGDENPVIQRLGQEETRRVLNFTNPDEQADPDVNTVVLQDAFDSSELEGNLVVSYSANIGYLLNFSDDNLTDADILSTFEAIIGDEAELEELAITNWSVRASFKETEAERQALEADLELLAPIDRGSFSLETVSPTVGGEVARAAFWAIVLGATVITGFIVIAFREVPNAFRFGVCAILAMVHDIFIMMGVMSLLGILLGWEVDALFLTALLTVVGFSVQDSIVVFDRIRENIPLRLGEPYETIVNRSLWETIHRSLATQLNAFFIMIALLLFGGETIQHFIFILFIGLLSGSYSSLFTAVPLLVSWEKGEIPFVNQGDKYAEAV